MNKQMSRYKWQLCFDGLLSLLGHLFLVRARRLKA